MKALSTRRRGGFTLVEVLVAIGVMGIMLAAMAQIAGLTGKAWRVEQDRIDNFTKARGMLSLLTGDLQRGVFRGDLPAFGIGAPSTTPTIAANGFYYFISTTFSAAFYTQQAGLPATGSTAPVRDVSLVSYALDNSGQGAAKIVLQRSDLDTPWTGGAADLAFQGDMTPLLKNAVPQEVAPGVVGFGLAFRRGDGTLIAPQDPSASGSQQYTGYNSANPVVAIDVCVAVIGKQTLAELSSAQVQAIQAALAGSLTANNLNNPVDNVTSKGIKALWDQTTLPSLFALSFSYPKDLGTGLKTFECWVACPPF